MATPAQKRNKKRKRIRFLLGKLERCNPKSACNPKMHTAMWWERKEILAELTRLGHRVDGGL